MGQLESNTEIHRNLDFDPYPTIPCSIQPLPPLKRAISSVKCRELLQICTSAENGGNSVVARGTYVALT